MAILAGLVGGFAADTFGLVAPFDISALLLLGGTVVVWSSWNENYGDVGSSGNLSAGLQDGISRLMADRKIWLVGMAQSFFEGSMYTFVFMWTPQLDATNITGSRLPYGMIFAIFMVSCMIGSTAVNALSRSYPTRYFMIGVFALAGVALLPSAMGMGFIPQLLGFCLFEACVGVYFPAWGGLRSQVVPEECRSSIMNLFRVPLNLIVVLILINIDVLRGSTVFILCVFFLAMATWCQWTLNTMMTKGEETEGASAMKDLMGDDLEAGEGADNLL